MKSKMGAGISGVLSSGDFGTAGKKIGSSLVDGISSSFGPLGSAVGEVATALGPTGIVATAAVAGAVIIGSAASQAAMEWEAGMSRVSKTTGIEKGSEAFTTLSSDLQDLYATMPTTVSEIQGVATAAGSLGIASDSIAGFTEVALQMGSAFEIPAEQAANAVGKIKSQLKSYSDEVKTAGGAVDDAKFAQHFGSAVDYAGNALNASESEVLDFSTRTAGAFSNLGGNMYELAGWGGELASVFSSSELASGSFNAALNQLMGTTKGSEAARAKAGELLGVTPEDFQELMTNDPTDTLLDIGKAMEGLSDTEKFQAAGILGGGYGDDFFQKMVGKTDEWRGKIDEVVAAGQKGESIGDSFAAGAANGKAAFQMLGNAANAILQDIGGKDGVGGINSIIAPVVAGLAVGLNKIRTIGENLWEPFTAAISPATEAVSLLADGIGSLAGMSLDVLVAGSEAINTAFEVGSAFVEAFGEEVTKVITESETFQKISGYVEDLRTAISSITFDDIISGIESLTGLDISGTIDSIETAISDTIDSIETAISGISKEDVISGMSAATGISTESLTGVSDFLGDVYDNAAEKLGWGVEKGTEEGMEKGSEAAKKGVEDAVTSAVEGGVNAGFDAAKDALVKSGVSEELAGVMSAYSMSDTEALAVINSQDDDFKGYGGAFGRGTGTNITTISGTEIQLQYSADKVSSKAKLVVGGKTVAETTGNSKREMVSSLLSQAGITSANEGNILDLTGEGGELWRINQDTEVQIVDSYLDFATNLTDEMASAGKEIGDALTEGIVPDTDTIQSSINSLKTLQLYDPEEFSEQGGENALAYLGAVQDALDSYEAAKVEYQMNPDNENAEQNLKTTRDNLQTILDANPLSVEVETKKWGEFDTKSLSELIYDPEELKKSVVDVDRFWEGTMLPDIKSKAESAKEAWESGQVTQDDIYKSLIEPLEALDEYTPDSIEALNELFQTGKIDISEYVDALNSLSSAADSVSESISESSSEASEMIAGLYYGTSGISTSWMDYINDEGGYTGPTKYYDGYADWKAEETATAQDINEKYGITTVGSISMEIEADASPAKSESDTLISEIETSDPTMTVLMDTTVADARFQNLYNLIVNSNPVVTVQLDFAMDDIRAIIESEVRKALK